MENEDETFALYHSYQIGWRIEWIVLSDDTGERVQAQYFIIVYRSPSGKESETAFSLN
jgi:hypothetical protein